MKAGSGLAIIGGIALDYVSKVKDVDARCTQVIDYSENVGGMAYNTAMASARLGIPTKLISAVGPDFPKITLPEKLSLELTTTPNPSTRCFLFHDGQGERIFFYRGPYHDIDIKLAKNALSSCSWAHFAGVAPCFEEIASEAVRCGKKISFNPGYDLFHYNPRDPAILRIVKSTDLLILNKNESDYLGLKDGDAPKAIIITTEGGKGSVIRIGGKESKVPAYKVNVLSPFGAGDTYTGTLIAALMKGEELTKAANLASSAASFAVEAKSTTPELSWPAIKKRAGL